MLDKLRNMRKALIAAAGMALMGAAYVADNFGDVLDPKWANALYLVIGVLTPVVAYYTPNQPLPEAE